MLNKSIHFIVFLFYTWCIYQSYFFGAALVLIFEDWEHLTLGLIGDLSVTFMFIIPLLIGLIQELIILMTDFTHNISRMVHYLPYALPLFLLLIVYGYAFAFWWKKQTILRAYSIALLGMFVGPGLMFCIGTLGDGSHPERFLCILVPNLFYILVIASNYLQKKYWPENKFCNRVRKIMQWPCIRT